MKRTWEESFKTQEARHAYNTAPVEALVRNVAYYLRSRHPDEKLGHLEFLEMGCGAGPNLVWLAERGIGVSGIDISPTALRLAGENLKRRSLGSRVRNLMEGSVTQVPLPDASFDGILESCVFQHLDREDRAKAFAEVRRLLKPGGIFAGYMLDVGHSIFQKRGSEESKEDPGTLLLNDGSSKIHLSDIGLSHFFRREEFDRYLEGFAVIDPCLTTYYLPREEGERRGDPEYLQSMWAVYAIR